MNESEMVEEQRRNLAQTVANVKENTEAKAKNATSRYAAARNALSEEVERVGTAFTDGTNLLSLLLLNPAINKTKMLPQRRRFQDHVVIEETNNGVYTLRLGCNIWAFDDPTELCIVLCLFLRNPEQMARIAEILTRRDGHEVNGIIIPTIEPVPEVAADRGTW